MNNYIGYFATSLAGHDKGLTYVITGVDNEYVYVTDGRLRQVDEPKKKKLKHIQLIKICGDLVCRVLFHLGLQDAVSAVLGKRLLHLGCVDLQLFREERDDGLFQLGHVHQVCRLFPLFLCRRFFLVVGLFDLLDLIPIQFRVNIYIIYRCAPRQRRSVGIIDGATVCVQGHGPEVIVVRQRLILGIVHDGDLEQLSGNCCAHYHQDSHADRCTAAHHCGRRTWCLFRIFFLFLGFIYHAHVRHTSVFSAIFLCSRCILQSAMPASMPI